MKLMGHHLICLHYYRGEGYSNAYVEHLWKMVKKAEGGEIIEVIAGADDICKACPYLKGDICAHKEGSDQEIRELDRKAFDFLSVHPGSRVLWSDLQKKVMAAPKNWFDSFCSGCDWFDLCTRIREKEGNY